MKKANNYVTAFLSAFMQPDPWGGDEPEHKAPEGKNVGSISGSPAQPAGEVSFWDDGNQVISGSVGNQMGGVVYLQPPSSAPKVMGVLIIIYAVINFLGIFSIFLPAQPDPVTGEIIETSTALMATNILNILIQTAGFGFGGYLMLSYQRKGMHLALATIAVATVLSLVSIVFGAADAANSSFELIGIGEDGTSAIFAGTTIFCQGVCALIVAIPLMVSNNGFDDSKLTDLFN